MRGTAAEGGGRGQSATGSAVGPSPLCLFPIYEDRAASEYQMSFSTHKERTVSGA